MSERGTFTSEYIYNENDYHKLRKELSKHSDGDPTCFYLSLPMFYIRRFDNKEEEMPIIQGRVGNLTPGLDYMTLYWLLRDIEVEEDVSFIVFCDCEDIVKLILKPDTEVIIIKMKDNIV